MKAFVAEAEWLPKKEYKPVVDELLRKRAYMGSSVWRNPVFSIKDVSTPKPGHGEALIRVKSCGICGSDTHLYETGKDGYIVFSGLSKFPCILGHEFAGVVEKTGPGVLNLKKGDIVAVESVMWCGLCAQCRAGHPNQCSRVELMGLSVNGAFAEFISVNERYCWKINGFRDMYPDDEVFDIGSLIEPIGCAYNGIFIAGGGFYPGGSVAVYGAGPIGLGAIMLSRIAGASLVIAFDVNDARVATALKCGADHAFNINALEGRTPAQIVMELTKGEGAEVSVEAAGAAPLTIPQMERSMASQGKIIYLGRAAASTAMHLDNLVTGANRIIGARGHAGYGIFPNIIRLIASGRLNAAPMISKKCAFDDVLDALKESSKRECSKIIIRI